MQTGIQLYTLRDLNRSVVDQLTMVGETSSTASSSPASRAKTACRRQYRRRG
ncbi:hypothetical protein ACFQH2_14945 [Natronoarchaeum sp. GCM10025703]|uniref:hypothetical protein n=1 Tax=Natronoarchaeum sp. GCM10025703 TaxID=3252685 RepID=UPI00360CC0C1